MEARIVKRCVQEQECLVALGVAKLVITEMAMK